MASKHQCDDVCVCPEHGTPLFYAPASDDHACQDIDCQYGHGGLSGWMLAQAAFPRLRGASDR